MTEPAKRFCLCGNCGWCRRYNSDPVFKDYWDNKAGPHHWARADHVQNLEEEGVPQRPFGLGDKVEQALTTIGITKERVSTWIGAPCNCRERQDKLNALGAWATRVLAGKMSKAKEYLDNLLS